MSMRFEVAENCGPKVCLIFDISTKSKKKRVKMNIIADEVHDAKQQQKIDAAMLWMFTFKTLIIVAFLLAIRIAFVVFLYHVKSVL